MATNTTNYGLKKPATSDFYNIADFNGNADIVDAQLKANANAAQNALEIGMGAASRTGNMEPKVTFTLTCTKSGKVYTLGNPDKNVSLPVSGLASCLFKVPANADYAAGDSFKMDNTTYAVATSDGEELPDKAFVSGAVVPAVLDQTSKTINFKQAGRKLTLSAESYIMVACYTEDGTFTAPMTGKYRVTCIAKGGAGSGAQRAGTGIYQQYGVNGAGGGAGGAGQITVTLKKGTSTAISANAGASFGSLLSATAGSAGTVQGSGNDYEAVPGTAGSCAGTGSTTFSATAATAGTNQVIIDTGTAQGGSGGAYAASGSRFLSREGGKGGDVTSFMGGRTSVKPSPSGAFPYGTGGGGGAYRCYSAVLGGSTSISYLPEYGSGAPGGQAAVIVELLLD